MLAGKYRIERVLGEGGMGVVVAAYHLQLEERVAIKFLLPAALESPEAVARFTREARAAVKIRSEHVARVSDVGTLESGAPYMVMEFLEGRDLAALVQQSGPLPPATAADYVLQACEAIAEAHTLGIIHRDLKPANLFLTTRPDGSPCIKVLDFGISKVTSAGSSGTELAMTRTQAIMGSPLYMSPEQMSSSRSVDARSDIWALGAILYELVSGTVPFEAETIPQLCGVILQEPPKPLRRARPDVPEAFEQIVLKCLEKDRGRRYQNVAELAAALGVFAPTSPSPQRIARIVGAQSPSLPAPSARARGPHLVVADTANRSTWARTFTGSRARTLGLVSAIAVALCAVALFFSLRPPSDPAPTATVSAALTPSPSPAPLTTPPTLPSSDMRAVETARTALAPVPPEPSNEAPPPAPSPSASAATPTVAPAPRPVRTARTTRTRPAPPVQSPPGVTTSPIATTRPVATPLPTATTPPRPTPPAPADKPSTPPKLDPLQGRH
ncbi:MAG: protein kinase [Pseudomonadota bacterium]|nr:MAG: serine/threonine protein kinase [Pseudomonadota bacterium]